MTSIIKLNVLSGAMDESPFCYLLQVDEFHILLDCGWDEKFSMDFIRELKKYVHQIDAVLLSFPDPLHLGAIPYMVGKCNLSCPIYATIPVYKMGQMFMYDLYLSRNNSEDFDLFTLDDVDTAFDKIIQLKYNQSVAIKGKGHGLTITPLPAGHMIGGTMWKIVKAGEEDIVYAVDFNHKKERHLNGCELEKIQRPSLLITDAYNTLYQQARRRARDEFLMTTILRTLRSGGNVLIGVDTSGRVLELAHMLDQLWRNKDSGLIAYSLALLNNVSYNVVEFAKSQIEWMSDKLMRSFEAQRNNPFLFKHVQLCHSLQELNKIHSPKVVLSSMPDMECGFSRDLFIQWCESSKNSIIITTRSSPGTLARKLIDNPGPQTITLEIKQKVRLEGSELDEYLAREREKLASKGDEAEDSSDESDDEMNMANVSKGLHDLLVKAEEPQQTSFFKSSKKSIHPMYPFYEEKRKYDEYGEMIRPEDYMITDAKSDDEDNKENVVIVKEELQDVPEMGVPTKCVVSIKVVEVNAQVQFIDFEGRSDGESLKKLLTQMKPRRLILVRGKQDAVSAISRMFNSVPGTKLYAPLKGEVVDVSTESHIYQVRLKESLLSTLRFCKGKDADLAWIEGHIVLQREEKADVKPLQLNDSEKDESGKNDDMETNEEDLGTGVIPTLESLPYDYVIGHEASFINELKLSDFKQVLTRNGISSEFSGGVLWCSGGTIALRRNEAGRVTIEGCVSTDYYRVRELLYLQYSIV